MKAIQCATGILLAAGLLVTAPGCAATVGYGGYVGYDRYDRGDFERRAYTQGYRNGLEHGRADAQHRRSFDYRRQGDFRNADRGYGRRDGDREAYRDAFRRGFVAGYNEAYRANVRGAERGRRWWR
jgi:hypothetical protein